MKLQFSVLNVLLATALVATSVAYLRIASDLSRVRRELSEVLFDRGMIEAQDPKKIYAIALPSYGPLQWRWRIQLPRDGNHCLGIAFTDIPMSGISPNAELLATAFPKHPWDPPIRSFILDVGVFKDKDGLWKMQVRSPHTQTTILIQNPPEWLERDVPLIWKNHLGGSEKTDSADLHSELLLLKYRRLKKLPSGTGLDGKTPTDGVAIWITEIPSAE